MADNDIWLTRVCLQIRRMAGDSIRQSPTYEYFERPPENCSSHLLLVYIFFVTPTSSNSFYL